MKHIKNNQGMTLVELIVSMGLFAVVITLLMSFFIVMQRLQMTYRDTANLQQEGRAVSEIFSRFVREAQTVTTTGTLNTGNGLCDAGGSILITMPPDRTNIRFTCSGTPRVLRMASCTPVSPLTTCTLSTSSEISSGQINVSELTIDRGAAQTYPKTLRYNLKVTKYQNGAVSTNTGETLSFPGYLVMRNEL